MLHTNRDISQFHTLDINYSLMKKMIRNYKLENSNELNFNKFKIRTIISNLAEFNSQHRDILNQLYYNIN